MPRLKRRTASGRRSSTRSSRAGAPIASTRPRTRANTSMSTQEPDAAPTDLLSGLEDQPPLQKTLLVALQHVFAVFVGMITPPLLIAGALKLDASQTVYLVSMSLFVSGLATVLQTRRIGPIGSGLLSIQGTSFTFIAPITATAGAVMSRGAMNVK